MYIVAYVVVDVSSRAKLNTVFLEDLYESVNECKGIYQITILD